MQGVVDGSSSQFSVLSSQLHLRLTMSGGLWCLLHRMTKAL